ncbi:unnamed protein product [Tilletia controversa]|nr:unnamed protein product [Tilletia controversa]
MPKKKGNLRGALVAHGRQQEQKLKQEAVLEAQKRKVESMKKSGGSGGKNEISKRRKTNDGKAGEQTSSAGTKDVAQSASKVQKPSRTRKERVFMPFQQDDSILLVGEGNFSFALSLLQPPHSLSPRQILATAYDSEQECYRKYPDAEAIVAKIRDLAKQSGREEEIVVFGVDAGNLSASKAVVGNPSKAAVVGYHRKGPQTRKFSKIWFGFPHVGAGHKDESRNILANQLLLTGALSLARSIPQQQPTTPGLTRSSSGFVSSYSQPVSQTPVLQLQAPASTLALSSSRPSAPSAGHFQLSRSTYSSAVIPAKATSSSPSKMPAASAASGSSVGVVEHSFTRAMLITRVQWNVLALAGLMILPNFGPVRGALDITFAVLSVLSAGVLDNAMDSLAEYGAMLAKVVIAINLLDAIARLQSKAAEDKSASSQSASSATAGKGGPLAKLGLGVRSSPQTRPSAGYLLGSSSQSSPASNKANTMRTPLYLQPSLRASLDEASILATPPRPSAGASEAQQSDASPFQASGGLGGANARRWPSGSPASTLATKGGEERNISPVQIFRARRAASGRGRTASGLQFDSSFDVGDEDGSTEAHEVDYGLKVLNSSFSADWSPSASGTAR